MVFLIIVGLIIFLLGTTVLLKQMKFKELMSQPSKDYNGKVIAIVNSAGYNSGALVRVEYKYKKSKVILEQFVAPNRLTPYSVGCKCRVTVYGDYKYATLKGVPPMPEVATAGAWGMVVIGAGIIIATAVNHFMF